MAARKIIANSVADAERLLVALTKHEKQLGPLYVTKGLHPATKKKAAKKAPAKLDREAMKTKESESPSRA
jgi:hypothetical protein